MSPCLKTDNVGKYCEEIELSLRIISEIKVSDSMVRGVTGVVRYKPNLIKKKDLSENEGNSVLVYITNQAMFITGKLNSINAQYNNSITLLTQVIVGGLVDKPTIYTLDPLGSVLPDEYAAVGTGAEMALGVLDPQYKKQMNEEEAVNLAVKAVRSASLRDSASGDGIDVLIINKNSVKEVSEKILATS